MPEITILNELINSTARLSLTEQNGRKSVELVEPAAIGSTVKIVGLPDNAIVIKVDAFRSPDSIFCGTKGECKRADYVIIANSSGKKRVLYVEMKKTKGSKKDIVNQLSGARCFVHYCQQIGKIFWNENTFLNDYTHRFVSFVHTSIPKGKTRVERPSGVHDRPDRMMKIHYPQRIEFNHLVGT